MRLIISDIIKSNKTKMVNLLNRDDIWTLSDFVSFIRSESKHNDHDVSNKIKGNLFETFAALFFELNKCDPEVGLSNYTPISSDDDYGVDGIGRNCAGDISVVQVKFRSKSTDLITMSELANTQTDAMNRHGVNMMLDNCIFLITNSKGVTHQCNEVFGRKLKVINKDLIMRKIDNNYNFWVSMDEYIRNILSV